MDALILAHFLAAEAIGWVSVTVEEVATAARGAPTVERVLIGLVAVVLMHHRRTVHPISPSVEPK
jgi:hypothetical protein